MPELQNILRKRVGTRILPQRPQRHLVGAGRTPHTEIDPAGKERLQRPELLGDHQRRMIRQHHSTRADTNPLRPLREVRDHDRRRRTRDPAQVVVLSNPIPTVAKPLRVLRQVQRITQRLRRRSAHDDRCEIQNRDGSTHPTVPDHGGRIKAIKTLLREGLRRVGEAEVVEPRMPTTADEVKDLNWDDFNLVFALTHATEKRAVADNGADAPRSDSRVAAKGTGDRPHSCSSSELPGGSSGVSPGEQNWPRVRFVSDHGDER